MFRWAARTFLRKLSLSIGLLILLTAGLVGAIASNIARRHLIDEHAARLSAQARLLAPQLPMERFLRKDRRRIDAWADRFGRLTGARVTLIALDGTVIGDSDVSLEGLAEVENHSGRPEIREALSRGSGSSIRHSDTIGIDFLYLASPIRKGAEPAGTLRLALPLSDVQTKIADLRRAIALASFLCLIAALALSVAVSRSIHQPVAELSEAADRLSQGDFDARAEVRSEDELGRLAGVMNSIAAKIAGMIAELSSEKAQLEATLDNMIEGVALIGPGGRIRELNPFMERLFQTESGEAKGKPYLETLRHSPLQELMHKALDEKQPQLREVTLFTPEERIFEAHANPILREGEFQGAVLVLHDITRLRRLEEVRKEFVANVSHELRTPLASIKGFAETLRRGAIKDRKHRLEFVETIESQADRLSRLVDDLLELASIESGKKALRPEPLSLSEAVEETAAELSALAGSKDVRIASSVTPDVKARADRTALRQILRNLIENAVKYNREGGTVEVAASPDGGRIAVSVSDTGLGIPAEDLPRLFERFYRVDKARSREMGGTGLGLSIVKHLVESHGGEVRAESAEGKGSTFRLTLPAV